MKTGSVTRGKLLIYLHSKTIIMAANDKLIPTALLIANNLYGTRYSTKGGYKLPAAKGSAFNPLTDAIQFYAAIYAKELKIAGNNQIWNYTFVNGDNVSTQYTPVRNVYTLSLGSLVAISEAEWNELQIAISRTWTISNGSDHPTKRFLIQLEAAYAGPELQGFYQFMGIFKTSSTDLKASDGTVLATGVVGGETYANAWNNLRVPYDATLGVTTPFIAPMFTFDGQSFYYRSTGIRRWFGFVGYNS